MLTHTFTSFLRRTSSQPATCRSWHAAAARLVLYVHNENVLCGWRTPFRLWNRPYVVTTCHLQELAVRSAVHLVLVIVLFVLWVVSQERKPWESLYSRSFSRWQGLTLEWRKLKWYDFARRARCTEAENGLLVLGRGFCTPWTLK